MTGEEVVVVVVGEEEVPRHTLNKDRTGSPCRQHNRCVRSVRTTLTHRRDLNSIQGMQRSQGRGVVRILRTRMHSKRPNRTVVS